VNHEERQLTYTIGLETEVQHLRSALLDAQQRIVELEAALDAQTARGSGSSGNTQKTTPSASFAQRRIGDTEDIPKDKHQQLELFDPPR